MRTWTDASVLIALDSIGEIEILRDIVGRVHVTAEVAREIGTERASASLRKALESWIHVEAVRGHATRYRRLGLGAGEASLFLTPREDILVLDDRPARRVADSEGRAYTGLLGLLQAAVAAGLLGRSRAREILGKLVRSGFRLRVDLYERIRREFEP